MKKLEFKILFIFSIFLASCTFPPPPAILYRLDAFKCVREDFNFNYRISSLMSSTILFCRKKYEDKIYGLEA